MTKTPSSCTRDGDKLDGDTRDGWKLESWGESCDLCQFVNLHSQIGGLAIELPAPETDKAEEELAPIFFPVQADWTAFTAGQMHK